ncbi:glycosyltransferase family 4 protein (plasmid) [Picosynechococcus sp. PCC 11901]|uniref:glycosyltransferase family 4 protein n=1 Tax=Picosynechococcus sp. PCC 11901 TaxID=2579791 RepID=UPI0010FBC91A|nr:glycosyltransferase family 1 protein [Picosynechococcus sp. PCC 11901]QCS48010.1 glycosyltransferase family 4 protein [Picosynechococcus sp. PCC 11901]
MNLSSINVVVDGYNLEMQKGTGIKTYAATLIKALISLNANVDVLCSRHIGNTKYMDSTFLAETTFFDRHDNKSYSAFDLLRFFIGQYFGGVKEIPITNFVIKQEGDFVFEMLAEKGKIFNSSGCYNMANALYGALKLDICINVPKKVDIWHATYPMPIKLKNAKTITTIHDLIPLKLPFTTLDNKKRFFDVVKNAIEKSDLILTVSENSRQDILKSFDVDPEKVFLTYQPIIEKSIFFKKKLTSKVLEKYSLQVHNYILFVGAIEPKKNVRRLIEAYKGLDKEMKLVIVGKKAWLWENELKNLESMFGRNFPRKVKILDYLPRADLDYLYHGAFCFVFPSMYEGFGLPPLEAMSFECPVVTSQVSSLPEICGNAAIYVNPYDSNDIRSGIEKLINNPQMRHQLVELGKERVKFFNSENYTKRIYEAYQKVM